MMTRYIPISVFRGRVAVCTQTNTVWMWSSISFRGWQLHLAPPFEWKVKVANLLTANIHILYLPIITTTTVHHNSYHRDEYSGQRQSRSRNNHKTRDAMIVTWEEEEDCWAKNAPAIHYNTAK